MCLTKPGPLPTFYAERTQTDATDGTAATVENVQVLLCPSHVTLSLASVHGEGANKRRCISRYAAPRSCVRRLSPSFVSKCRTDRSNGYTCGSLALACSEARALTQSFAHCTRPSVNPQVK